MLGESPDFDANFPKNQRTKIRREAHLGSYLRSDVYAVVDASPVCHVGYVLDGAPFVTPTMHWRKDNRIYWHGSVGSRFLRQVDGARVCVTCSLVDGYVLARSAFYHNVNYRSAMMFGIARAIEDIDEKKQALRAFIDGLFPDRWDHLRPITEKELRATAVISMDIEEATVKVRNGAPSDGDESHVPVWAGVIPMRTTLGEGEAAPELPASLEFPTPLATLIASGRLR
jgi:uncharacterized protein